MQYMPSHSAVEAAVVDGTATIYFESNVDGLTIISTDENPEEPMMKIDPNLWYHRISTAPTTD